MKTSLKNSCRNIKYRVIAGRIAALIIVFAFAVNVSGCASLMKKFTRKKTEDKKALIYKPIREYQKPPAEDRYQRHYLFWQSWHSELVKVIGENHKKDYLCISEIIGNLTSMKELLAESKADELAKHIGKLTVIQEKIARGALSTSERDYAKRVLDKEERSIKSRFGYKKMQTFIKKE